MTGSDYGRGNEATESTDAAEGGLGGGKAIKIKAIPKTMTVMVVFKILLYLSNGRGSRRGQAYSAALTASFRALPATNFGALLALIVICSPVDGLRPVRSARLATENVPNPTSCTDSPHAKARDKFTSTESSTRPVSALLRFTSAAIAAIISVLFKMEIPFNGWIRDQ